MLILGVYNGGDTTYDPTIYTQGLMITHGKHMIIGGILYDFSNPIFAIAIWRYHVTGSMGTFIDHKVQVRNLLLLVRLQSTSLSINADNHAHLGSLFSRILFLTSNLQSEDATSSVCRIMTKGLKSIIARERRTDAK
jgi:hypothetical protein